MLATETLYVHKQVLAHKHIHSHLFQQKDCSPKSPQSEKRKEEGYTALSQTGHPPLLQPQRQPALISESVFLQVLSSPSPHLWEHHPNICVASWAAATSGVWAWATPATVTVPSATDKGQHLQSPGCNAGILKGCSSQHQNLTELFCWVINVTALLQTWACFVILPPHSKWICWVLLRKRKVWCPILRSSDLDTKREKNIPTLLPSCFSK